MAVLNDMLTIALELAYRPPTLATKLILADLPAIVDTLALVAVVKLEQIE